MRRALSAMVVGSAVAAMVTLAAPPASAATDTIHGGCFFDTIEHPTASGQQVGIIGDRSVTQQTGVVPSGDVPIAATVYCRIEIDGVAAPGTTFAYTGAGGVEAGANEITYTAAPFDDVWVGERVVYADGTDTGWDFQCRACAPRIPPQEVTDDLDAIEGALNGVFVSDIDPKVCPALVAVAGSYGPVTIEPDGDVVVPDPASLGTSLLYDCPPYVTY